MSPIAGSFQLLQCHAEFDEVQAHIRRKQRQIAAGGSCELAFVARLPRKERRQLERERLKAQEKERTQGGKDGP